MRVLFGLGLTVLQASSIVAIDSGRGGNSFLAQACETWASAPPLWGYFKIRIGVRDFLEEKRQKKG